MCSYSMRSGFSVVRIVHSFLFFFSFISMLPVLRSLDDLDTRTDKKKHTHTHAAGDAEQNVVSHRQQQQQHKEKNCTHSIRCKFFLFCCCCCCCALFHNLNGCCFSVPCMLHWKRNGQHSNFDRAEREAQVRHQFFSPSSSSALVFSLCVCVGGGIFSLSTSFHIYRILPTLILRNPTPMRSFISAHVFSGGGGGGGTMICCSRAHFTVFPSMGCNKQKNHYFCSQKKNCCDGMDIFNVCCSVVQQDLFHVHSQI